VTRLRYSLIGSGGSIAEDHLDAVAQLDVDLESLVDHDAARGAEMAEEFGARFFSDHRTMLAETSPDVAVVATPHPSHAEIAIDCLQSGAHVLVEKPMAVEVAEADAMIDTAVRTERVLGVCFQFRFRPAIEEAHRLVSSGALGRLLRVACRETMTRTDTYYRSAPWLGTWGGEGGGVLLNQGPHALDLLFHLAGPPVRVSGWTRTLLHSIEAEDTGLALLEFESGAVGEILLSTVDSAPLRLELVGERGTAEVVDRRLKFTRWEPDLRTHVTSSPELHEPPKRRPQKMSVPRGEGDHLDVHRDFLEAVREGREPRASGREGLASLELANAIVLSDSLSGAAVDLPLDREAYSLLLAARRAGSSYLAT
jgi:UDP-N-acetyl-2-amino-2-deoxyglucuronate dehydrogenase